MSFEFGSCPINMTSLSDLPTGTGNDRTGVAGLVGDRNHRQA